MQRHLTGLAHGAAENHQRNSRRYRHADAGGLSHQFRQRRLFKTAIAVVVEQERARLRVEPQDAQKKSEVANARDDKRLLRRRRGARFVIPETNQQIRRQPDQFPADEQQQQAVRDGQAEYRRGEQRHETEKPSEVVVVGHVPDAVNEDQHSNERDHHEHDGGKRIEHPAESEPGIAELEPVEGVNPPFDFRCRVGAKRSNKRRTRQNQRQRHGTNGHGGGEPALRAFGQRRHRRRQQRQRGNEPEVLDKPGHLTGVCLVPAA